MSPDDTLSRMIGDMLPAGLLGPSGWQEYHPRGEYAVADSARARRRWRWPKPKKGAWSPRLRVSNPPPDRLTNARCGSLAAIPPSALVCADECVGNADLEF